MLQIIHWGSLICTANWHDFTVKSNFCWWQLGSPISSRYPSQKATHWVSWRKVKLKGCHCDTLEEIQHIMQRHNCKGGQNGTSRQWSKNSSRTGSSPELHENMTFKVKWFWWQVTVWWHRLPGGKRPVGKQAQTRCSQSEPGCADDCNSSASLFNKRFESAGCILLIFLYKRKIIKCLCYLLNRHPSATMSLCVEEFLFRFMRFWLKCEPWISISL